MYDRTLLELAAKASGLPICINSEGELFADKIGTGYFGYWNPLTDDGDALRLAVKLEMIVDNFTGDVRVKNGWSYGSPNFHTEDIPREGDHYAATRRAIVRAAAALGKEKKGD